MPFLPPTHIFTAAASFVALWPCGGVLGDFACECLLRCDIEMYGKVTNPGVVMCDRSELHNGFARVNSHSEVIPRPKTAAASFLPIFGRYRFLAVFGPCG